MAARKTNASTTRKSSAKNGKNVKKQVEPEGFTIFGVLNWLLFAGIVALMLGALVSYDPKDPPAHTAAPVNESPTNWVGIMGAALSARAYRMMGLAFWFVPLGIIVALFRSVDTRPLTQPLMRAIGLGLMATAMAGLASLEILGLGAISTWLIGPRPESMGGLLGYFVSTELTLRFNVPGAVAILMTIFLVGATLCVDKLVLMLPRLIAFIFKGISRKLHHGVTSIEIPRPQLALPGNVSDGLSGVGNALGSVVSETVADRSDRTGSAQAASKAKPGKMTKGKKTSVTTSGGSALDEITLDSADESLLRKQNRRGALGGLGDLVRSRKKKVDLSESVDDREDASPDLSQLGRRSETDRSQGEVEDQEASLDADSDVISNSDSSSLSTLADQSQVDCELESQGISSASGLRSDEEMEQALESEDTDTCTNLLEAAASALKEVDPKDKKADLPTSATTKRARKRKKKVEVDDDEDGANPAEAYIKSLEAEAEGDDPLSPDALREKMRQLPINFAPKKKSKPVPAPEMDLSGYQYPGMDLLVEGEGGFTEEQETIVREQAMNLEQALKVYRVDAEVVGIDSGPVITQFEVRLAPGTKVSRVNGIDNDLARAMKAPNIRVVPTLPGRDTIGIEVPNIKKEKVRMKDLISAEPELLEKMHLPMFLGKDASGNPLVQDLAKMPHMLIAGTTGSGKSVCMNAIILSFLFACKPDELKLVLVDPKMVEMSQFRDIPHLMCPVVTEMHKAAAILEWAVVKMDERYNLLKEVGVRDIVSYNKLGWDEIKERLNPQSEAEEARIPKKLPYMVFVIDELADLMMTNKEVEGHIVRIAQKARAVGMHLILATQRPSANVVTGLIKSNMPSRIAFKVASGMDSRIVLDTKGAELLLGYGDMLFLGPRSADLTRAQGSLVEDEEIRDVVNHLKSVSMQSFEPQLVSLKANDGGGGDGDDVGERDELFDQAVEAVLDTQRGSVSLLQRRFSIGYSRASRIIEQIEAAGIIGAYKGSQAREVNMTLDEWKAMKAQAEADEAEGYDHSADYDEDSGDGLEEQYKDVNDESIEEVEQVEIVDQSVQEIEGNSSEEDEWEDV